MSPTQLVIGVFLFLIGFLVGRWVLERGSAPAILDPVAAGQPMSAGYPRSRSMPAAFARTRG